MFRNGSRQHPLIETEAQSRDFVAQYVLRADLILIQCRYVPSLGAVNIGSFNKNVFKNIPERRRQTPAGQFCPSLKAVGSERDLRQMPVTE